MTRMVEYRGNVYPDRTGASATAAEIAASVVTDASRELRRELVAHRNEARAVAAVSNVIRARKPGDPGARYTTFGAELDSLAYRDAYTELLRGKSLSELSLEHRKLAEHAESRDLSSAVGSGGAYTIPSAFYAQLTKALSFADAVRSVAQVITTREGRALRWPTTDDRANAAAILADNTQATVTADPVFAQNNLYAWSYVASLGRIPLTLIQDVNGTYTLDQQFTDATGSAATAQTGTTSVFPNPAAPNGYIGFSPTDMLAGLWADRLARGAGAHFTTGTGVGQPLGVTAATVGATTASPTAITYTDLLNLWYSVGAAYRRSPTAAWMMHSTTMQAIGQLNDASGRPLWLPKDEPTLFGKPIIPNDYMPTVSAGAVTVVAGDFKAGYIIRDVEGAETLILRERYADYLQVGVIGHFRTDGTLNDVAALRSLKQHS